MTDKHPSLNKLKFLLQDEDDDMRDKIQNLMGDSAETTNQPIPPLGAVDAQGYKPDIIPQRVGKESSASFENPDVIPRIGPNEPIPSSSLQSNQEYNKNAFAHVYYNGKLQTTILPEMFKTRNF